MIRMLKTGLALALAFAAATGAANAFDLQGGGQAKLKTTKVQLGIISPDNCPGKGEIHVWAFTNKPGNVSVLIVEKSGDVLGPYQITTVAGSGGVVLGTYQKNLMIHNAIDEDYRVVSVDNPNVHSNWVPLTACL
jgi:hypothetical protein